MYGHRIFVVRHVCHLTWLPEEELCSQNSVPGEGHRKLPKCRSVYMFIVVFRRKSL